MSVKQLESAIQSLPPEERRQLVEWLDDHRHELVDGANDTNPAVRAEVELRLKESDEHPEVLEPFEEADLDRMIHDTVHAHAQKAQARPR